MREYIAAYQGAWWHFFIKPFYGLCFRKKENGRFQKFEVLLPEACEDFCVLSAEQCIHVVCQTKIGSILYLCLDNGVWRKTVLLESKSGTAYPKHFSLIAVGGFLNLFYTIQYQEKWMLVHQIIVAEDKLPMVVDRIRFARPPFSVSVQQGTDISVLYQNESSVSGSRLYRWSAKLFGHFMPVNPAVGGEICCFLPDRDGCVHYAAFQVVEGIRNLVYFTKTGPNSYTEPMTVYLDCHEDVEPIFCRDGNRLCLVWQEAGCILSSYRTEGEGAWSRPTRYMVPGGCQAVQYGISQNGQMYKAYGYAKEQDIIFHGAPQLSEPVKQGSQRVMRPEGYEVEEFAKENGVAGIEEPVSTVNPIVSQLRTELSHLKEQLYLLKEEFIAIKDVITNITEHKKSNVAEEEDVDTVLLENNACELQEDPF